MAGGFLGNLFGGGPSVPDAPDMTWHNDELGKYSNFFRDRLMGGEPTSNVASMAPWSKNRAIADGNVVQSMTGRMKDVVRDSQAFSDAERNRYNNKFAPGENQLARNAAEFGSKDFANQQGAGAIQDVNSQFDSAREEALGRLESFGIDPSQTRNGALDRVARIRQAEAAVGAGNAARMDARRFGLDAGLAASQVGQNIANRSNQSNQLAAGVAGAVMQGRPAADGQISQNRMGVQSYLDDFGFRNDQRAINLGTTGMGALGSQVDVLNSDYENRMTKFGAKSAKGANAINNIGKIAGVAAHAVGGFAEGGMVPDEYEGSTGVDDQVPAMLSGGEYIVPSDIVRILGTKFLDGMVEKARRPAVPTGQGQGAAPDPMMEGAY